MRVSDVAEIIEEFAPLDLALGFDNVGLLVGDGASEVVGTLIAVDATREVVERAINSGVNLIITHHPIIFNPIKRIIEGDYVSEIVRLAVQNNVNIYSAHTNMDKAKGGINYSLASLFGGRNITPCFEDNIGVRFERDRVTGRKLFSLIAMEINDSGIKYYGNLDVDISKIALISGCGGRDSRVVGDLIANGIQLFITAEMAHHVRLELEDRGILVFEYGHYESETIFIDIVYNLLAKNAIKVLK